MTHMTLYWQPITNAQPYHLIRIAATQTRTAASLRIWPAALRLNPKPGYQLLFIGD